MNKKAQIANLFMYALGIILVVVFFAYGIKFLFELTNTFDNVNQEQLKDNLISDINQIAQNYGSEKVVDINLKNFNNIIFIDSSGDCSLLGPISAQIENECESLSKDTTGEFNNIFLLESQNNVYDQLMPLGYSDKINLKGKSYSIINAPRGIAKIKLVNIGSSVNIIQG